MKSEYVAHFYMVQKHVKELDQPTYGISAEVLNFLLKGYDLAWNEEYSDAEIYLGKSWKVLRDYPIDKCNSEFLRLIGNLILSRLINREITKDMGLDTIDDLDENKKEDLLDGTISFCYLWLAFEVSNYTDYDSLISIATLFEVGIAGMLIAVAGFVETMPPSRSHFLFAAVALKKILTYTNLEKRSRGDLTRKRWLSEDTARPSVAGTERNLILDYHQNYARMRIGEIAEKTSRLFGPQDTQSLIANLGKPIAEDDQVSYDELFEEIITNLKMKMGGQTYRDIFAQTPIELDQAIAMDNPHAIFTIMYAKESQKCGLTQINTELAGLAREMLNKERFGLADKLAFEAYGRISSIENKNLLEQCQAALIAAEA